VPGLRGAAGGRAGRAGAGASATPRRSVARVGYTLCSENRAALAATSAAPGKQNRAASGSERVSPARSLTLAAQTDSDSLHLVSKLPILPQARARRIVIAPAAGIIGKVRRRLIEEKTPGWRFMGVDIIRPRVGDLVFQLYGRPLHPELFDILAFRKVQREDYELTLRITRTGHVITWENADVLL